jgi:hypothetical protein
MSNSAVTLDKFFAVGEKDLEERLAEALEGDHDLASVKDRLLSEALDLGWSQYLARGVTRDLSPLLKVDMEDILVNAWNKGNLLNKYLDEKKYPPGQVNYITLSEHKISSQHHPYVQILVNGHPIPGGRIEFNLTISLALKETVLMISDGKIKEIMPCKCQLEGTLKYRDFLLFEQKSREIALPSMKLGEGRQIRG